MPFYREGMVWKYVHINILNELISMLFDSIPLHTFIDSTPSLSHLCIDPCLITLDSCIDPERSLFTATIEMIYWR